MKTLEQKSTMPEIDLSIDLNSTLGTGEHLTSKLTDESLGCVQSERKK